MRPMSIRASAGLAGAVCALTLPARADTISVNPSKDNTLYESATGSLSNGMGQYLFAGTTGQNLRRRALVRFDLSAIPPGSIVTAATVTMTVSQASLGSGSVPVSLHNAAQDWGEGNSMASGSEGMGAPSAPGDATWIHTFYSGLFWSSPGGDFIAATSATVLVDDSGTGTAVWASTPRLAADVQGWLNPLGVVNFGWIVIADESTAGTARRFNSRNNSSSSTWPVLTVTYVPPSSCYANCDGSTGTPLLNVTDFTCFLQKFATGDLYANCDGSTNPPVLNVNDFTCFLQKFSQGCSAP